MVEVNSIPEHSQAQESPAAQIDSADLVVGVLVELDQHAMQALCDSLCNLPGSPRIVVLQSAFAGATPIEKPQTVEVGAHPAPPGTLSAAKLSTTTLSMVPWSSMLSDPTVAPHRSISAAAQSLFEVREKLDARACCLVASHIEGTTPEWVSKLAQPLLDADFDLVLPYYPLTKLQGLLNSSILYPLNRALYGKRIHNPLGPDVGVSRKLSQKILGAIRNAKPGQNSAHPLASLASCAVCDNLSICQVHVGARSYPPIDWTNTSTLLAQVLEPIFLNMEKNAPCWQRMRGSVAVPTRGEPISLAQETDTLDMNRMLETFKLGVRDLLEIWGLVLPPATLFELRTLSRLTPENLDMPDELWARIVYDFALAHRLRTINRDHLLRSMTPLYLAWVSSYARELESAKAITVEQRLERLAQSFETAKPYLLSRWRWPDRFNP